jgi:excisionase family DNA binding protein
MDSTETAKVFKVSLRTVDTLIGNGELPVRRIGRRVLIPTDEVERFAKGVETRKPQKRILEGETTPATA